MDQNHEQADEKGRKILPTDVFGLLISTDWERVFVTNELTNEKIEVRAEGQELVVTIDDPKHLKLGWLHTLYLKTAEQDRRYECAQMVIHRVNNLTIQISNLRNPICALQVRAYENTLAVKTTSNTPSFKAVFADDQKMTIRVD